MSDREYHLVISAAQHRALRVEAAEKDVKIKALVSDILQAYLSRKRKPCKPS
jgi:hypothetical protein